MTQDAEIAHVILQAEAMTKDQGVIPSRTIMDWFEKAVQVSLRYDMELRPQERGYIVMLLEVSWGRCPTFPPSLNPPNADHAKWLVHHIMYLLHPDNDDYPKWRTHAFIIMNECRRCLGMPPLEQITSPSS